MGVTVLQQYPVPDNKTGTFVIELLTKRILALGAAQQGSFLVDCESYLSLPMDVTVPTKTVHILHNSEQPASVFSILESGSKNIHVIADGLFDLLMMKLSQHYTSKKQTKIESKGPRFELGDFCVKLGSVTMNQNFKGILIEVEYRPCVMANAVWGLLREFLQGLLGPSIPVQPPQHLMSKMNDIYTPIDTIYQYLEHFSAYRKITTGGPAFMTEFGYEPLDEKVWVPEYDLWTTSGSEQPTTPTSTTSTTTMTPTTNKPSTLHTRRYMRSRLSTTTPHATATPRRRRPRLPSQH